MAGVDQLYLGFMTRQAKTTSTAHNLVAIQTMAPGEVARQIGLKEHNVWGIIKTLCGELKKLPEGRYVLQRDANDPKFGIYKAEPAEEQE